MNLCDKCFSAIETGATFCKECGAPIGTTEAESDALVYPELAKSNVLRMQGDYENAEKVCLAILKRFPNNPGAHVLMGDIMSDAGRGEQAKQWYEMALELTPENASLKAKSERIAKELAREKAEHAMDLEVPKSNTTVLAMSAIAVVLVGVAVLSFWLGGQRASTMRDKRADVIEPLSVNGTAAPRAATPENAPPAESPNPKPESSNPPVETKPAGSNLTAGERTLLQAISADLGALHSRVLHLSIDTQASIVIATVEKSSAESAEESAITAARIGSALIQRSNGLSRAKVRLIERSTGEISFSAAVTADALRGASAQVGSIEWAKQVLSDITPPLS